MVSILVRDVHSTGGFATNAKKAKPGCRLVLSDVCSYLGFGEEIGCLEAGISWEPPIQANPARPKINFLSENYNKSPNVEAHFWLHKLCFSACDPPILLLLWCRSSTKHTPDAGAGHCGGSKLLKGGFNAWGVGRPLQEHGEG